ncbi:hypothetical protein QTN25_005203 [Entamoeba marina]
MDTDCSVILHNNTSYTKLKKSGGYGTFGVVSPYQMNNSDTVVAMKRFRTKKTDETTRIQTFREIKYLRQFNHPNIVKVIDIFYHQNVICMALEYHPTTLEQILPNICNTSINFNKDRLRKFIHQILNAVYYLHSNFLVIHRDIKPSNILISTIDDIVMCDFGNAVSFQTQHSIRGGVITPSYRAPELLLQPSTYAEAIDMWSVGCVFIEMFTGETLFNAPDDFGTIALINKYYEVDYLSCVTDIANIKNEIINQDMLYEKTKAEKNAMDLMTGLLNLNPPKRYGVEESLMHQYFV